MIVKGQRLRRVNQAICPSPGAIVPSFGCEASIIVGKGSLLDTRDVRTFVGHKTSSYVVQVPFLLIKRLASLQDQLGDRGGDSNHQSRSETS